MENSEDSNDVATTPTGNASWYETHRIGMHANSYIANNIIAN